MLMFVGLAAVWFAVLRPQWLGGSTAYIVVKGDSMMPTHENGDLLVMQAQNGYAVGDVVAYRVPEGEIGAGHLVVHRIAEVTATGFLMLGDNNPAADPWTPSSADIAGRVTFAVPHAGHVIAFALQPIVAGGLAAAVVIMGAISRMTRSKPLPTAGGPIALQLAALGPQAGQTAEVGGVRSVAKRSLRKVLNAVR
jgi:signal peptidase